MARPRFNLKSKHEEESLIFLVWDYKRLHKTERFKYSTRIFIPVKAWDFDKREVKRIKSYPHALNTNALLRKFKSEAERIFFDYTTRGKIGELTKEKFKEELDVAFDRHKTRSVDFIGYFERHIEAMKEKNLEQGTSTYKHYNTELVRLRKYFEATKKVDFEEIDLEWMENYKFYLFRKLNLNTGTVNKAFSRIKTVLRTARDRHGVHKSNKFETSLFTVGVIESGDTYLTMDELKQLALFNDLNEYHEKIRDVFLLQCFTGLRVSDWEKINLDNFTIENKQQMFRIFAKKTNKMVSIPAHPIVLQTLNKYGWKLPNYAPQYLGREIKKICKAVGINQLVTLKESKGGIIKPVSKPKHELIRSHTPRRSFATNAWLSGIDLDIISGFLGHSDIETTRKYIKATGAERIAKVSKNEFFKGEGFLKAI